MKRGTYYSFVPSSLGSRCSPGGLDGGFIAEISQWLFRHPFFEAHKKKFIDKYKGVPRMGKRRPPASIVHEIT